MDARAVGKRIKKLRIRRDLSQQKLADRAGVHRQTIANIELFLCKPSLETIEAVAGPLGVTRNELLGREAKPSAAKQAG